MPGNVAQYYLDFLKKKNIDELHGIINYLTKRKDRITEWEKQYLQASKNELATREARK